MSQEPRFDSIDAVVKFYGNLAQVCEDQQVQIGALQAELTEYITENYRYKDLDRKCVQQEETIRELQSQISALRLRLEDQL